MMAHKSRKFHGNIHRRGAVDAGTTKKKDFSVGPVMLGFFGLRRRRVEHSASASIGVLGTAGRGERDVRDAVTSREDGVFVNVREQTGARDASLFVIIRTST